MLELKIRLGRAEHIARSESPVTGLSALDAEFCFLQIRRIIELITFSAALRDEARYKKLRELQKVENKRDHGDYSKDWEAAEILKQLSDISPHFLPIPIKQITNIEPETLHIDRSSTVVTHGRLIEIYKQCGGFLHAKNPLGKNFAMLIDAERRKYEGAHKEIEKQLRFIRSIIWRHAAIGLEWSDGLDPREMANPQKAWLVDFGNEDTHEISIVLAEAQDS
jgi:hypothetical protein